MNRLKRTADRLVNHFNTDSLFRNATFLMASTAVMSVLGFLFWVFVAHLYPTEDIGVASALISISLLITNLSLLGLNSGLIRFIPESREPSRFINAAIITVTGTTVLAGAGYLLLHHASGGTLGFFLEDGWHAALFVGLMVAVSLNTLTDAVFIANRKAQYHTVAYTAFGLVRLVLPLGLMPLGALGIFAGYSAAAIVSLVISFHYMKTRCGYVWRVRPDFGVVARTRAYAGSNYLSVILAGLPSQLAPTLIIARLGASESAYFSMAWTMANLLYVIPTAISQSLLAEGAHDRSRLGRDMRHAARILAVTVLPVVGLSLVVAPYLLHLFGAEYAEGSTQIFQLLAIGTLFLAVNGLGSTWLNVEKRAGFLIAVQALSSIVTLGGIYLLADSGMFGVGLAFVAGGAAAAAAYGIIYLLRGRLLALEPGHKNGSVAVQTPTEGVVS